jgi:hypothetical protein
MARGRYWAQAAAILAATAFAAAGATSVAIAGAPASATARCADGTYSYSATHSGTCSHHGGVSRWLDGSSSPTHAGGTTTADGLAEDTVRTGATVLLGRRMKTSRCRLGANPDRACSPGAYYEGLTKPVICSPSFHTSSIRHVPDSEKHAVEAEYGLAPRPYGDTLEIDHIVSLELGGSNDIANLYPEKANADPGYHVKDGLENKLHALVCSGAMSLRNAQRGIASDWQALYRNVYGTAPTG